MSIKHKTYTAGAIALINGVWALYLALFEGEGTTKDALDSLVLGLGLIGARHAIQRSWR